MRNALHKGLQRRLWFYFALVIAELSLSIMHILADGVFALYPLVALAVGIWIGRLLSRAFHISWDEETKVVVTRWDAYGIIILVLSGILEFYKEELVGYFVNGSAVVAISFALIAGIMYGRVAGMSGRAAKVIEENR